MSIIIGIDHGYYAIKTAHCSFPAGLTSYGCLLYTSPSPRDAHESRMPSSA